jgi:hypothetical protein
MAGETKRGGEGRLMLSIANRIGYKAEAFNIIRQAGGADSWNTPGS